MSGYDPGRTISKYFEDRIPKFGGGGGGGGGGIMSKPNLDPIPAVVAPTALDPGSYGPPADYNVERLNGTTIDQTAQGVFRAQQEALAQNLTRMANGTAPSLAQMQAHAAMGQATAQQFAMANSARGGANPGLQRSAMMQAGEMGGQAAAMGMQGALAERMQATQALGGVLQGARGQDIQLATDQAKLTQEAAIQQRVNQVKLAELTAQYKGMGLDAAKAQQLAEIEVQKLVQQQTIAKNQQTVQLDQNTKAMYGAGIGAVGQGVAAFATKSDRNAKTDIRSGEETVRAFLDAMTVNDYKYKDPKDGVGRFVSPMAQDLLKTEVGKSMVVKMDDGQLGVDYGRGLGTMLAATAHLHDRLEALEKKKGKK